MSTETVRFDTEADALAAGWRRHTTGDRDVSEGFRRCGHPELAGGSHLGARGYDFMAPDNLLSEQVWHSGERNRAGSLGAISFLFPPAGHPAARYANVPATPLTLEAAYAAHPDSPAPFAITVTTVRTVVKFENFDAVDNEAVAVVTDATGRELARGTAHVRPDGLPWSDEEGDAALAAADQAASSLGFSAEARHPAYVVAAPRSCCPEWDPEPRY
jgi:hypothetical protein